MWTTAALPPCPTPLWSLRIVNAGPSFICSRSLDGKLRLTIRHKITAGVLPGAPPKTVWAGIGTGRPCDACDETITAAQTEIELEMPSASRPLARLHRECFAIWREECDHR